MYCSCMLCGIRGKHITFLARKVIAMIRLHIRRHYMFVTCVLAVGDTIQQINVKKVFISHHQQKHQRQDS